jgi:hypothetical protein
MWQCKRCGTVRTTFRNEDPELLCDCEWPDWEEDRDLYINTLADERHQEWKDGER